jgi:pyruvate,water dikinase
MIKWLREIRASDRYLVGGKAANLGELMSLGFNVPNGFVVTHPEDWFSIGQAHKELNCEFVAVRSSAICEDGSENSFAGQYDSYLNVTKDQVVTAIYNCFDSINNGRAISYSEDKDMMGNKMAVIVQEMINPDKAGVIFTKHPVTDDESVIVIEAVNGLGEQLVSGSVTPTQYVLNKITGGYIEGWGLGILGLNDLSYLWDASTEIEGHYNGSPQDIEFAIKGEIVWICQARPITT